MNETLEQRFAVAWKQNNRKKILDPCDAKLDYQSFMSKKTATQNQ